MVVVVVVVLVVRIILDAGGGRIDVLGMAGYTQNCGWPKHSDPVAASPIQSSHPELDVQWNTIIYDGHRQEIE